MGVNGVVIVVWSLASVLAVGCWNLVKFVVTRARAVAAVSTHRGGRPLESATLASRSAVAGSTVDVA